GTIENLIVTVNGSPVAVTHSGLGQTVVSGSGVIQSSESATYNISVTGISDQNKTASDAITISVIEKADPANDENCPTTVVWWGDIASGKVHCAGDDAVLKFTL